jgi:hypothetical protein
MSEKRVIWTHDDRYVLANEMANYISGSQVVRENGTYPFRTVVTAAQKRLGWVDRGKYRECFTTQETKSFKAIVAHILASGSTSDKIQPPSSEPVVAAQVSNEQAVVQIEMIEELEENPDSILAEFIASTTKLSKLLISERQARHVLESKVAKQQTTIEEHNLKMTVLRKALSDLEDFLTSPQAPAPTVSIPEIKSVISIDQHNKQAIKKQRVYVVGMEDRNHAHLQNTYGHKFDLRFWHGWQKRGELRPREEDYVYVVVDFCGHNVYDKIMDSMKRRGLKSNVITVNGGMSALSEQFTLLLAKK